MLKLLTNPLYLIIALAAGAWISRRYKKRKWYKWLRNATVLLLLITFTNPLPEYLVRKLERKYPTFNPEIRPLDKQHAHILVLGGGFTNDTSLPPNSRLASNSLTRVVEGIRVHRLLPNSEIIFSGKAKKGNMSIAETMKATAIALGVDTTKIHTMTKPATTAQEADHYQQHFYNDTTQLIIATSAIHMPRAMLTFSKRRLSPIPAPTNHTGKGRLARSSEGWWGVSAGNMRKLEKALREMLAIQYEKMTD